VTQRFDTGTLDRTRGRAEPLVPRPALHAQSPGEQVDTDTSSVGPPALQGRVASFGPFRLHATERLVEKNGAPLKIGSRGFDILVTLLEHAPEVVSKRELISRAWGNLVVDEASLRVHVTALRKQLAHGRSSVGYVTNVPGRGYCFAGAVTWTAAESTPGETPRAAPQLPRAPLMVGRDNAVRELSARLKKQRFVSIVGPGGIGKTTIALALAHQMLGEFHGAIHFLDLAPLEDPQLLASVLATHLGLTAVSDQPLPLILTFLRDRRLLLVFDSCEHVIGAIAVLTETIFGDAPQVHILATSREALRAEGEQVHHLPPLECPPPSVESLTATQALSYPAVQLFVKHVPDGGHPFELTNSDASTVAEICRRLDGIPLALELAASRVGVYGVQGTASLLDKHFRLLWHGRRTALPRHQTLRATLDWSYQLLSSTEQLVLRRLAIFVASFSLAAALDVASEGLDASEVTETLGTLVDKSLVTLDNATAMRYRLLETTRAYAWQKLSESAEDQKVARRACEHLLNAAEQFGSELWAGPRPESIEFFHSNLGNLRAALDWCFSERGDKTLGAKLAGASTCLFLQAGLLSECAAWAERGVGVLDPSSKGTRLELELLARFSQSLMDTRGNAAAVRDAITRALDIAKRLKTAPMELYLLQLLYKWQIRTGDFRGLGELTGRIEALTKQVADPLADAVASDVLAVTCFFTGNNREVQRHAQIALAAPIHLSKFNLASFEHLNRARAISTLNLWVLGYPEQAMMAAIKAVAEADELAHPVVLCRVLMACLRVACLQVALETGDCPRAEQLIQQLSSMATKYHLLTYARTLLGWEGWLAVSRGELSRGIHLLQTAIDALHRDGFELYRPQFTVVLADGLANAGEQEAANTAICEAITWADSRDRKLDLIELLRVKGEILSSISQRNASESEGETCLLQALQLAKERGLLSLELRSGISLARHWAQRGEISRACDLLEPIFGRFTEGFQTRDLLAAATLLKELRSRA
jgi:predicted ATPase/DNA-binding winged helix-turn-helix (wHTH) protein